MRAAMKEEIAAAVFFVARLVKRYGCLDNEGRERFAAALTSVLFANYKNHWHPSVPTKGQAYRSVKLLNLWFYRRRYIMQHKTAYYSESMKTRQLNRQNKTNLGTQSQTILIMQMQYLKYYYEWKH